MEFLAHLSGDQWAKIPTRLERFQILKELEDEVRRLHRTYVLRKTEKSGSTVVEPSAPEGYESSRDYNLIGIVDSVFVPGYYADFLDLVSALMRRRARLRRYAAHRVGRRATGIKISMNGNLGLQAVHRLTHVESNES